ncbi:MAG: ABC transporter permease [Chloroflexota bacterium]|nr:ABC transporter permease [Chloroflexota bacterium]
MTDFLAGVAAWYIEHPDLVGRRLVEHVALSAGTLLAAVAIAGPIGLLLGHARRGSFIAINVANVGRAVPSLALMAIAVPFLGIHAGPAVVALILLAIPPILTNTFAAVSQVDADAVDAARGMGMREMQILRLIELPLAAPVIMAGVRIAAVQVVATATLAAVIAGGGLGRLIVDGIAVSDEERVFAGALAVAVLAVGTELVLGAVERALAGRGRVRVTRADPIRTA